MASKIEHTPAHLKRRLRQLADPAARKSQQRFFKETVRGLGVRTPDVRRLAARTAAEYRRRGLGVDEVHELAGSLWAGGLLEERSLAVFLVQRYEADLERRHWQRLEGWTRSLANWAETDGLCIYALAPLLQREPSLVARLDGWTRSSNPQQRRAAAVALVPLARRGRQHEAAFHICALLAEDQNDLVQKGVGWLLKEISRTQPRPAVDFLQKHRSRLSRLTVRYASAKLPPELKRRATGDRGADASH